MHAARITDSGRVLLLLLALVLALPVLVLVLVVDVCARCFIRVNEGASAASITRRTYAVEGVRRMGFVD